MRSGEDDEAKIFTSVLERKMRLSQQISAPVASLRCVTSLAVSMPYCAPAEACMRSGEDDEAKNFEDLYVT